MTPSQYLRQWCGSQGYTYKYGNPTHINVWMGETDFSASTGGVCVFAHLLTASDYDPSGHDRHNIAVYFATLTPFDFDTDTIDQVTEGLHARAKSLLAYIQQGNAFGWDGARFQYGYDDYAENVAWCCLRVTLTDLAADCVPLPAPPEPGQAFVDISARLLELEVGETATPLCEGFAGVDNGEGKTYIAFGAALSETPISESGITVMSDGLEDRAGLVVGEITEEIINFFPDLADYAGWWLAAIITTAGNGEEHTITVTIAGFANPYTCTFEL